jgi:hypothetical protein
LNKRQHPEQINKQNATLCPAAGTTAVNPLTQPFSPTTQDLTTMSDNDLISFINPSLFGENII